MCILSYVIPNRVKFGFCKFGYDFQIQVNHGDRSKVWIVIVNL
jgi:hypothetical protein